MKKYKIIILIILGVLFPSFASIYAKEQCETLEIFDKYLCRSENICKIYDINKKIYNPVVLQSAEKYKGSNPNKTLEKITGIYKDNMNDVYKCALINVQKNSLNRILQATKTIDKNLVYSDIEPKIQKILSELSKVSQDTKCLNIDKNTVFHKSSVLNQTTYLTCDYHFYLEYLKEYYGNPKNIMSYTPEKNSIAAKALTQHITSIQYDINQEIEHAYTIFPIAYQAYSEYENNFPIHYMLEVIKQDFHTYREKLHKVLNPINQVVYKISNAMKK